MKDYTIPPQCIGITGGGQLGRMLAIAAKQMGYKVAILDPDKDSPAIKFADYYIKADFYDKSGLKELAKHASVITTEFENIPAASLIYLKQFIPVYPDVEAILIAQNRFKEKSFFKNLGIKTAFFQHINSLEGLKQVDKTIFPAILKTATLGYDGKGQIKVDDMASLESAFTKLNQVECVIEQIVEIKLEVSLIIAQNKFEISTYPIVQNIHKNGILDLTIAPAPISEDVEETIKQIGLKIINELKYIGVLAIEFFITKDNKILVNEMAPRVHNSGHHTLECCQTSQFEQQIRSVCNLKLGLTKLNQNAIMINLLGEVWFNNRLSVDKYLIQESDNADNNQDLHLESSNSIDYMPDWGKVLQKYANVKLHLYEKSMVKIGRKMGHLTVLGNDMKELWLQANKIKLELKI